MRTRMLVATAATALLAPLALFASSQADPATTPNGPWPTTDQDNLNAIHSYDQLWSTLRSIQSRSKGAFDLEAAPLQSNTGRDIPVVTIGDGAIPVMFVANQHGDEFVVSTGMIEIVRAISGGSRAAQEIRDALTVT